MKRNLYILLLLSGITIFLFAILIGFFIKSKSQITPAYVNKQEQSSITSKAILINLYGEIRKPGVYKIPAGTYLVDLIANLGGFTNLVDLTLLSKSIDLSQTLEKSVSIYVPGVYLRNEGPSPFTDFSVSPKDETSSSADLSTSSNAATPNTLVNINSASAVVLDELPGIGQTYAQKIISGRPYVSIDDLISKKIISISVFNKIKSYITI